MDTESLENPAFGEEEFSAPLKIFTLGRFALEIEGEPLDLGARGATKRMQLLKALVALGGNSVPVTHLTDTLWPDADGDQAINSFHTTLSRLRSAIGIDPFKLQGGRLSLDPKLCWVDIVAFTGALDEAAKAAEREEHDTALARLEAAMQFYRGPFLDGEDDPPEIPACRTKLHEQFLRHMNRIGRILEAAGKFEVACQLYQKGLEVDEVSDELLQNLMRACLQTGNLARGLSTYEACKSALKYRYDVEPSPETEALRQALLDAQLNPPAPPSPPGAIGEEPAAVPAPAPPNREDGGAGSPGPKRLATVLSAALSSGAAPLDSDDSATLEKLHHLRAVLTTFVEQHGGRVVNAGDDALLAEFDSGVEALKAASAVQHESLDAHTPPEQGEVLAYRIALHLGEVWEEEGRLVGEVLAMTTRMTALAEPGGICVSGLVVDQVKGKLPIGFAPLSLKGEPNGEMLPPVHRVLMAQTSRRVWRRLILASAAVLIVVFAVWGGLRFGESWSVLGEAVPEPVPTYPALPDNPSLVVLPFKNLSDNPQGKVYSDGLTVNLIMQLSRLSGIFVISDYTSFAYKKKTIKLSKLGRELGVRYVASGSVQIAGEKMRVIFSLTDAGIDRSIIAASYDRKLADWFKIQDDIIRRIIISLQVNLSEGEQGNPWGKSTKNLETMTLFWQGMDFIRQVNQESNRKAIAILKQARALNPNSAVVFSALGFAHYLDGKYGWSKSPQASMQQAAALGQRAMAIDPKFSDSYTVLGVVALSRRQYDSAIELGRKAVELSPNGAEVTAGLGMIYNYAGQPKEAIKQIGHAMRLSPRHPTWYSYQMGLAHYLLQDYGQAIQLFEKLLKRDPRSPFTRMFLTASYIGEKRLSEARRAARIFRERNPEMHPAKALKRSETFRDPSVIKGIVEKLKAAGLE